MTTSTWHSVNPSTRPLTLAILELTPLALTLSLTLSSSRRRRKSDEEASEDDDETPSFKDLLSQGVVVSVNGQAWSRIFAHVSDLDDEEEVEAEVEVVGITQRRPRRARFVESAEQALRATGRRKGRVDKDRAVVVVYGLSPGSEYEVDLRVVGMQDEPSVCGLLG
jgi:hypothetical protein